MSAPRTVPVPQSVKDALADAETFMRVLGICYPVSREAYRAAYHARWCAEYALRSGSPFLYGSKAARAAFRAVPGLRGEEGSKARCPDCRWRLTQCLCRQEESKP